MVIQTVNLSISEMKEQALKLRRCISSYKTENNGWTARVANPRSSDEEGVPSYDVSDFEKMTFGRSEREAVIKAYIHVLEEFATYYITNLLAPKKCAS